MESLQELTDRTHQRMVPSRPPAAFSSLRLGFATATKTSIAILRTDKATNYKFCMHTDRINQNKIPLKFREKWPCPCSETVQNFRFPIYRAHRAFIFKIAQLSCGYLRQAVSQSSAQSEHSGTELSIAVHCKQNSPSRKVTVLSVQENDLPPLVPLHT